MVSHPANVMPPAKARSTAEGGTPELDPADSHGERRGPPQHSLCARQLRVLRMLKSRKTWCVPATKPSYAGCQSEHHRTGSNITTRLCFNLRVPLCAIGPGQVIKILLKHAEVFTFR